MATAELHVDSNQYTLPVVKASAGPDGIVVSKLRNDGWVTLDPGFLTTAQCESKITFIDGNRSILRYRGYPIEQLCEHSDFLEVAWLLRHGDLPTQAEYDRFCSDINHKTMVGEDFRTFMGSFPRAAHPMSVLAAAVNALAAFYPDTTDITDSDQLDEAAKIIMAKARTVVSYIFRRRRDEPMLYPDLARGYVDDFLRMCFAVPYERFDSDPLYVHALGRLLIIHADHEQNCSTSVVRIAGSAHANLYAAISAGINALSGPLHGGANEAVLRQLKAIRDSGKSVRQFVEDAKAEGHRISGLGHRVYKSYDPRAAIARLYLEKIIAREDTRKLPADERALFDVAVELEDIALNDEYFVSRHLYPNVDFYTGLIYRAIGFDPAMFTTLFALGRIPGWIAQYREMLRRPEHEDRSSASGVHRRDGARLHPPESALTEAENCADGIERWRAASETARQRPMPSVSSLRSQQSLRRCSSRMYSKHICVCSASDSARCSSTSAMSKRWIRSTSRCRLYCGYMLRLICNVSMMRFGTAWCRMRCAARSMNLMSNCMMLCPIIASSPHQRRKSGSTVSSVGAGSSMSGVMPVSCVMNGLRLRIGLTNC